MTRVVGKVTDMAGIIVRACIEQVVEGNQDKNKCRSWETWREYFTMPKTNQLDALRGLFLLHGDKDERRSRCYSPSVGVGIGIDAGTGVGDDKGMDVGTSQVERSVVDDSKSATTA